MFVFYLLILIKFSQDILIPYPFIKNSHNTLELKSNSKLELNKKIYLENNTIKVDLDTNLVIDICDAVFTLNKLPEYYLLNIEKGNFIISGKGRAFRFKILDTVIEFVEGQMFLSVNNSINLLINEKTQAYLIKDTNIKKLETKNYYLFDKEKLTNEPFNNYKTYIDKIFDIEVYKKLIKEDKALENDTNKIKGKIIFCLKNLSSIKIDSWYVNNDILPLSKTINEKKFLNICKNKYKDIVSAGEYEIGKNNCLFINNSYCQDLKINNEIQLISVSAVLLSGYDKVFIKTRESVFYELNSKWLFLQAGSYTFRLGTKLENAIIYEEKVVVLKGSKKVKISDF